MCYFIILETDYILERQLLTIYIMVIINWMLTLWSVIASFHSLDMGGGNVLFCFVEFFEGMKVG